jgi:hypothetical protein
LDTISDGLGDQAVPTRPLPAAAKLFVLVPLVAMTLGARRGSAAARSRSDAALRGVCAGVAFAGLVVIGVWASALTISTTESGDTASLALGAQAVRCWGPTPAPGGSSWVGSPGGSGSP